MVARYWLLYIAVITVALAVGDSLLLDHFHLHLLIDSILDTSPTTLLDAVANCTRNCTLHKLSHTFDRHPCLWCFAHHLDDDISYCFCLVEAGCSVRKQHRLHRFVVAR